MNMTVRKATDQDVELLTNARLRLLEEDSGKMSDNERALLYQSNKEHMQKGVADGSFFAFLAFDGEHFIGTCSVCLYAVLPGRKLPNGKNAYIQNMYVDPPYRGNGVAKMLVSMATQEALDRGHSRITLHATRMGQALFVNCGFIEADNEKLAMMVYEPGK